VGYNYLILLQLYDRTKSPCLHSADLRVKSDSELYYRRPNLLCR